MLAAKGGHVDAIALLRNRLEAVRTNTHTLVGQTEDLEWAKPLLPGTSPLGLTLWHLPRTVDWLVNATIRGVPEVAERPEHAGLPSLDSYGFGTGLSEAEAAAAAARVHPEALLAYADDVHADTGTWLDTLQPDDLDRTVPEFDARQRTRASYCTPGALAEVEGLRELPIGVLLLRPAISHQLWHMGEIDLIGQLARR